MSQRKKKQSQLVLPYNRAPRFLRFNPYIKKGYRVNLSTFDCFRSLLWWTNETLNIWSHLLGFFIFLGLFIYDVTVVYYQYQANENADAVVATFVLACFMICMLLSSLYHTFNCLSEESCRTWLSYDIFGISVSFLAIFISGIYYGFWCPEIQHLRNMYTGLVCILFAGAMTFLLTPRLMGPEWEWARIGLFSGWALSGFLPTIHWALLHGGVNTGIVKMLGMTPSAQDQHTLEVFLPRIFMMYAIGGTAVMVYIWKIPERFFPGRFDFVGASHQLWHLIIVAALVYWHQTGLEYAYYRSVFGCGTTSLKE